jgi:hypothetical protein
MGEIFHKSAHAVTQHSRGMTRRPDSRKVLQHSHGTARQAGTDEFDVEGSGGWIL